MPPELDRLPAETEDLELLMRPVSIRRLRPEDLPLQLVCPILQLLHDLEIVVHDLVGHRVQG